MMLERPVPQEATIGQGPVGTRSDLRVLVINFTLDRQSPVLAWQAGVVAELAKRVQRVHVFTEWLGDFEAPEGVTLDAMPHRPLGVPRRLGAAWLMLPRIMSAVRRFRPDVCFVHMAHKWCYRIGPYLRARGIPVLLWYAHGSVPCHLHLASACASRIVTSTPEGFRIATHKKRVIGQAIDTGLFVIPPDPTPRSEIVTVGRVSRRKRVTLLIEMMSHLVRQPGFADSRLVVVGPELTADDKAYRVEVDAMIAGLGLQDRVALPGPMAQADTARLYRSAALHVNVSATGSMDKTVMEALACGCPVLTSNEAFFDELASWPQMLIRDPTAEALAQRVASLLEPMDRLDPSALRNIVVGRHDLDGYADRIVVELEALLRESRGRLDAAP
jgi:glycosyltransferase involved in cell wall biosynthesis